MFKFNILDNLKTNCSSVSPPEACWQSKEHEKPVEMLLNGTLKVYFPLIRVSDSLFFKLGISLFSWLWGCVAVPCHFQVQQISLKVKLGDFWVHSVNICASSGLMRALRGSSSCWFTICVSFTSTSRFVPRSRPHFAVRGTFCSASWRYSQM